MLTFNEKEYPIILGLEEMFVFLPGRAEITQPKPSVSYPY